jgi:long-chain fatty acid transport protein
MMVLLVLVFAGVALANEGVFVLGNDAQQISRASSGVASPRSAYWSYMNPGSIIALDDRLDLSLYTVFPHSRVEPNGILANNLDGRLKSNGVYFVPCGGAIYSLGEYGTIGGGIFAPSGTGVKYRHSRNLLSRLVEDDSDRQLAYQHMRLVLSYAYELPGGVGIGIGLYPSLSRLRTDHLTLRLRGPENSMQWDNALGMGAGIGLYKAWSRIALGISYESRNYTEKMDKYSDLLAYSLDTPQIVQAGVAVKVLPQLELTLDLKYLNWKSVDAYGKPMLQGGFNWCDQYGVKVGAEWTLNEHWRLMAGFSYANTPIDIDHVAMSVLVPVAIEDNVACGFSYAINKHHEVHFAAMYGLPHKMKDSGHGSWDLLSWTHRGTTLTASGQAFALGYSYKI